MPPFFTGFVLLAFGSKLLLNSLIEDNVEPAAPKFYCETRHSLYRNKISSDLFKDLIFECDERPATDLNNFVTQKYQFSQEINSTSSKHVMRQLFTVLRFYLTCKGRLELPRQVNCSLIDGMVAKVRVQMPKTMDISCSEEFDDLEQIKSVSIGMSFRLLDVFERGLLQEYLKMSQNADLANTMATLLAEKIRSDETQNIDGNQYFHNCLF